MLLAHFAVAEARNVWTASSPPLSDIPDEVVCRCGIKSVIRSVLWCRNTTFQTTLYVPRGGARDTYGQPEQILNTSNASLVFSKKNILGETQILKNRVVA